MRYLQQLVKNQYAGFSYEQASRRAQEVCAIAAETGQTVLAHQHLTELVAVRQFAVVNTNEPGWPSVDPFKGGVNDLSRWEQFGGTLRRPEPPASMRR